MTQRTAIIGSVSLLPLWGVLLAAPAWAQQPVPVPDRPPPINDPAPDSPIDRPRNTRGKKPVAEAEEAPKPLLKPRAVKQGWIGWSVGSGYGWHGQQTLETRTISEVGAGFGAIGVGHFGIDVGAQWNEQWALSLQTRHQVIPRKVLDTTVAPSSKPWAHSIFARAAYIIPREGAQLYVGGMVGGGEGFRFRIDPAPSMGLGNSDTVRGGPFALGPVAGFVLPLLEKLSLVGEARALVGVPDVAAALELNIGAQFDFFQL
ncbi:MAG TPA: hypothetical protein VGG33_10425 [Polyangia bacterium]